MTTDYKVKLEIFEGPLDLLLYLIKRDEIESSPYAKYKNAVTRAVGANESVEADTLDFDVLPGDAFLLERCKPVYETLPGWKKDIGGARRLTDLPPAARRYVDRLAELIALPVTIVSVGPDREQTILCR